MVSAPRIGRRGLAGGAAAVAAGTLAGCRRARPGDVRVPTAHATVRHLAEVVGPRPGTTPAFYEAADWVAARFERLTWQVEQQRFPVPGGFSWVAPVAAGDSVNVIAQRGDLRPGAPWLAVGAHLDTVPRSPGAEDNASGIGVLLAVAEAITWRRTRLPVVLIAFGAEEPRGDDRRRPPLRLAGVRRRPGRPGAPVAARHGGAGPGRRRQRRRDRQPRGRATRTGTRWSRRQRGSARRWSSRADNGRATTGPSCGRGCPAYASAARRTPATTRPRTWWRSWTVVSSNGPRGWSSAGSASCSSRR